MASQYECPGCGYIYDEKIGDPDEGFPPGTQWVTIPEDWFCPDCAVRDKPDFQSVVEGLCQSAGDE